MDAWPQTANTDAPTSRRDRGGSASIETTRLRAAVIGLGVGQQHIKAYDSHPACAVTTLCDICPTKRDELSQEYPELDIVADPRAVLSDPAIDVVSIASYDDAHAEQIVLALEHGKHVFVEKPLCLDIEELRQVRAILQQRPQQRLSCNLILRLSPRFQLVRQMIRRGRMGRLFHVEGEYNYGRVHKLTQGWRGRIPNYSVVLGGAVHLIDQLLWLTGERIVQVAAFGNGIGTAGSAFAGNDMAAALLRFASGMTGTVTANFGCVRPHGHGLTICGTEATFVNDDPHGRLYTSRDASSSPQIITADHPGAAKGDLIANFLDSILGCSQPQITQRERFETMFVCLAIQRAQREQRIVEVEYK